MSLNVIMLDSLRLPVPPSLSGKIKVSSSYFFTQYTMDIVKLYEYVEKHILSVQKHETEDLLIWNYTAKCQYDFAWDDITTMCRGLITDSKGNVISRPLPKFFNMSEHHGDDCKLPPINWDQEFSVTEKMDGSLGITYPIAGGYALATRGSFVSEQAIKGTEMLQKLNFSLLNPDQTYLFEILYPENRIVIDYEGTEELVLLDVIRRKSGESIGIEDVRELAMEVDCKIPKIWDEPSANQLKNFESSMMGSTKENREGVVVKFKDGMRIKVKLEEYVRLHRLITGTSARSIWDILRLGGNLDELIDRVPDEYHAWVKETERFIKIEFGEIEHEAIVDFEKRDESWDRKEFAEYARNTKHPALLFCMLDEKDYKEKIWKMIRPKHSTPFKDEI